MAKARRIGRRPVVRTRPAQTQYTHHSDPVMFKEIEAVINDSSKHVVRDQRSEALAMLKEMEGVLSDLKVAEEDAASTHNLSNHPVDSIGNVFTALGLSRISAKSAAAASMTPTS